MNIHFKISLVKSLLRITGCVLSIVIAPINLAAALFTFVCSFGIAEILGVLEEIFDSRK